MDERDWVRTLPFYRIDEGTAEHLFSRLDSSIKVARITPLLEGMRNSNYRVEIRNNNSLFLLRIFSPAEDYWKKEEALLSLLAGDNIPVHKLYLLSRDEAIGNRYYAVYNYVEGRSLSAAIHAGYHPDNHFMENLARILALIHSHRYKEHGFLNENLEVEGLLPPLEKWYQLFTGENARRRLGREIINRIEQIVRSNRDELAEIENQTSLVHGDFRPTNILVTEGIISCIFDWEYAMAGHLIADIGQLFRRKQYFTEEQKQLFIRVYREASGRKIPENWAELALLRDLVNLLQMIDADSVSPEKYRDLKELITGAVNCLSRER